MKARFEVWRVLTVRKAYSGYGRGLSNAVGVRISRPFGRSWNGYKVWVAVISLSEAK